MAFLVGPTERATRCTCSMIPDPRNLHPVRGRYPAVDKTPEHLSDCSYLETARTSTIATHSTWTPTILNNVSKSSAARFSDKLGAVLGSSVAVAIILLLLCVLRRGSQGSSNHRRVPATGGRKLPKKPRTSRQIHSKPHSRNQRAHTSGDAELGVGITEMAETPDEGPTVALFPGVLATRTSPAHDSAKLSPIAAADDHYLNGTGEQDLLAVAIAPSLPGDSRTRCAQPSELPAEDTRHNANMRLVRAEPAQRDRTAIRDVPTIPHTLVHHQSQFETHAGEQAMSEGQSGRHNQGGYLQSGDVAPTTNEKSKISNENQPSILAKGKGKVQDHRSEAGANQSHTKGKRNRTATGEIQGNVGRGTTSCSPRRETFQRQDRQVVKNSEDADILECQAPSLEQKPVRSSSRKRLLGQKKTHETQVAVNTRDKDSLVTSNKDTQVHAGPSGGTKKATTRQRQRKETETILATATDDGQEAPPPNPIGVERQEHSYPGAHVLRTPPAPAINLPRSTACAVTSSPLTSFVNHETVQQRAQSVDRSRQCTSSQRAQEEPGTTIQIPGNQGENIATVAEPAESTSPMPPAQPAPAFSSADLSALSRLRRYKPKEGRLFS